MSLSNELKEAVRSREEKMELVAWGTGLFDEIEKHLAGKGTAERSGSAMTLRDGKSWVVIDLDYNKRQARVRNREDQKSKWMKPQADKLAALVLKMI